MQVASASCKRVSSFITDATDALQRPLPHRELHEAGGAAGRREAAGASCFVRAGGAAGGAASCFVQFSCKLTSHDMNLFIFMNM